MIKEKHLFLDLGDTLVEINEPFETYTHRALKIILGKYVSTIDIEKEVLRFLEFRNAIRRIAHSTFKEKNIQEFFKESFADLLDIKIEDEELLQLEEKYIKSELDITNLFDDVHSFMDRAFKAQKKIFIATNNFSILHVHRLLERFKLNSGLEYVLISGEVGWRKPHPAFLQTLLHKFHLDPDDCLIIGDKYEMDILAGIRSGVKTCLINRKDRDHEFNEGPPDYIFKSLNEIHFV